MRKWMIALLAAVLALPVFGSAVFADDVVYQDGEYTIIANALQADSDEPSAAGGFLNEQATVSVNNGEITLTISSPIIDMAEITGLQIEGVNSQVSEDGSNKYFSFELASLTEILNGRVQYDVPAMNMIGHDVALRFSLVGLNDIPVVEVEEEPQEPAEPETPAEPEEDPVEPEEPVTEPEEPVTEPEQPETEEEPEEEATDLTNLSNGFYTVGADYLRIDNDDSSSMGRYLDSPLFLAVNGDTVELTVTVNEDETVTLLQVAGKDPVASVVDGEKRHDTFEFGLDELDTILNAYVEYQAAWQGTIFESDAEFRIVLDEATISETEESAKPGYVAEEPVEEEEEEANNEPEPTPTPTPAPEAKEEVDATVVDRAFEINFIILDEEGNEVSAADQFFVKPATLLEKDGVYYVQIATNANQFIESLANEYGDFLYVGEDEAGNHLYQFRVVGDLVDNQIIDMVITVPGVYEGQEHTTQLVLDTDSMLEVNADAHQLATSNENANGPNEDGTQPEQVGGPVLDDNAPDKPELGAATNGNAADVANNGQGLNPKTGEETNLLLYVLLMIASAVPLVIKARKRFA